MTRSTPAPARRPVAGELGGTPAPARAPSSPRYRSTADYVTAEIQHRILSGALKPGARLDQIELAAQLDVSRHPVRQAIDRLAERGFVTATPHHSAVVAEFSAGDLDELYRAREVLEPWAVAEAGRRDPAALRARVLERHAALSAVDPAVDLDGYMSANRTFHLAMYEACGNRHLLRTIATLFDLSERYQRTALANPERIARSRREHDAMAAAVRRSDWPKLAKLVSGHNQGTRATVRLRIDSAQL